MDRQKLFLSSIDPCSYQTVSSVCHGSPPPLGFSPGGMCMKQLTREASEPDARPTASGWLLWLARSSGSTLSLSHMINLFLLYLKGRAQGFFHRMTGPKGIAAPYTPERLSAILFTRPSVLPSGKAECKLENHQQTDAKSACQSKCLLVNKSPKYLNFSTNEKEREPTFSDKKDHGLRFGRDDSHPSHFRLCCKLKIIA